MPRVGRSRQPMMFIVVDFPEPDAPMIATNSPSRIVSETPRKRVNFNIAHRVGLVNVIQLDHRTRFGQPASPTRLLVVPVAQLQTWLTSSLLESSIERLACASQRCSLQRPSTRSEVQPYGYRPAATTAPVRGALPNPGGRRLRVRVRCSRPISVWPVITMSPSFKSPSTTSVDAPSLRPP